MTITKLSTLSLTFGLAACSGQMDKSLQSEITQKAGMVDANSSLSMASLSQAVTATSSDSSNIPQICIPEAGVIDAGTVSINGGAASTESPLAVLSLGGLPEILRMKISNDANCECGNWELYSETKQWELVPVDGVATVGVQYKDYEGRVSQCVTATIAFTAPTTTTLPPVTTTTTLPPVVETTTTTLPPVVTTTTLPEVVTTTTLPPVVTTTTLPPVIVTTTTLPPAVTTTTLPPAVTTTTMPTVTTTLPAPTTTTTLPTVTTTTLPSGNFIHQEFGVNASNKKVDILIVDDNSGSMRYEQKSMAQRMSTFLSQLKGLDWRVAITTTDPKHALIGDGRLIEMKGLSGQYFITSQMDFNMAQKILGDTIQRKETGSPHEQGIYVTYRALERAMGDIESNYSSWHNSQPRGCDQHKHSKHDNDCGCKNNHNSRVKNPNKDFFRADANLAVIVISDENESAKGVKNIPENLLKFVKTKYPNKLFNFHSIITRSGDKQCLKGEGRSYGKTYELMSKLTGYGSKGGSIIGSVCERDYGSQLSTISETCQQFQKMVQLKCAPVGNPTNSVKVQYNGSAYSGSYQVQGDRLVFDNYLPAGSYKLDYSCK